MIKKPFKIILSCLAMLAANSYASNLYVPSLSTAKGIVEVGIDAKTDKNSSAEPSPALIKITESTQLPPEFQSNFKSCVVSASGWGDKASGRVNLRLNAMSCETTNGSVMTVNVTGYIVGDDGISGVKGSKVNYQGQNGEEIRRILPGRTVTLVFTQGFTLKPMASPKLFISGKNNEQN